MKIASLTSTILVLKDFSFIPYFVGIIFIGIGVWTLFFPTEQDIPFWIKILFPFMGLLPLILYKKATVTFDKLSNLLTIELKGLSGKKIETYPLNEIKEINLALGLVSTSNKGGQVYGNSFTLNAMMKDGTVVVLGHTNKGSLTVNGFNLSVFLARVTQIQVKESLNS